MNHAQYVTAIMDELRHWAHAWLEGLRELRQLQTVLGQLIPYPSHPLPAGFPFGQFSLSHRCEWIHEYGSEQLRHIHNVDFLFQGRTNGPGSSIAWSAVDIADQTDLGVFEIAGPIYDDATPLPFRIDTDLVLEGMSASLRERVPIHLASRVVAVVPNEHPDDLPRPLRIYELRTANQTVIRVLGSRWEQ
ncbi:hypothetical protein B0H19DRAFT_1235457 [Mycena capillaripes]|nr:hypothetical protein B0H19DRAFT_1235457 [Mycena capillaripes]